MKKIFLFISFLFIQDSFAQGQWWPVYVNIHIPAVIQHDSLFGNSINTTFDTTSIGFFASKEAFKNYRDTSYQKGNFVWMEWIAVFMHFSFDTLNKNLTNFFMNNGWDHSSFDPQSGNSTT